VQERLSSTENGVRAGTPAKRAPQRSRWNACQARALIFGHSGKDHNFFKIKSAPKFGGVLWELWLEASVGGKEGLHTKVLSFQYP